MADINPILRWAGSKRKLLPYLINESPTNFNRYYEPFCGSACLFAKLQPERAVLGDLNHELIDFYSTVRRYPKKVAQIVHDLPQSESFYYDLRALSPTDLSKLERAARFLYLNRFCFNGVYRTNRQGLFNVARGKHMGKIPSEEEICGFAKLLKTVELRQGDFSAIIADAGKKSFIYLDPPYADETKRDRGEYGPGAFRQRDLNRFRDHVENAAHKGADLLISFADRPSVRSLFNGWFIKKITVGRSVAGFSEKRQAVNEVLISNRPLAF